MAHSIVIVLLHCVFSDYCYCLFTVHLCSCACTHVLHVLCPVMFVYMYICTLFNYIHVHIISVLQILADAKELRVKYQVLKNVTVLPESIVPPVKLNSIRCCVHVHVRTCILLHVL